MPVTGKFITIARKALRFATLLEVNLCEFIRRTLTDPSIFWGALEAIATLIAAAIIISELRRARREAVAHKVEGFQYGLKLLESEEFQRYIKAFDFLADNSNAAEWHTNMPLMVQGIFQTMEVIDMLIKEKYLDEDFFFKIEGNRLANLGSRIRMFEEGKETPRFEEQQRLYPNGRDLLHRAERWKERFSNKKN